MTSSFVEIVFASLFRHPLVEREKLPWPGATAANATIMSTLHKTSNQHSIQPTERFSSMPIHHIRVANADGRGGLSTQEWSRTIRRLFYGSISSAILVCFSNQYETLSTRLEPLSTAKVFFH